MKGFSGASSPSGIAYLIVNDIRESTAQAEALGGIVEPAYDAQRQGRLTVIRTSEALLVLRQKEDGAPAKHLIKTNSQ